jgi:hypothetical protein
MFSLHNPTESESQRINQVLDGLRERNEVPSWAAASVFKDRAYPAWLMLCHQMFTGQHASRPDRASALVTQGRALGRLINQHSVDGLGPERWQTHLCPGRVVELAQGQRTRNDTERLLIRTLQAGGQPAPGLSMPVLLVGERHGPHGLGVGAYLDLWRVTDADSAPRVLRAPGLCLAVGDKAFETSLARAQALLQRVRRPNAPSVALGLRPRELPGQAHADPVLQISGDSLGAALAVGALHLLLDHLQPGHEDVRDLLQDLEPNRLAITGKLADEAPGPDGTVASAWPNIDPIGGQGEKRVLFQVMRSLDDELGDHASPVPLTGHIASGEPVRLDRLIDRMVTQAGLDMTPAIRRLHHLLVRDDAIVSDRELIDEVHGQARPHSLKAWLVWRWAQRAGGQDAVFAHPTQLAQRFTRLVLAGVDDDTAPDDASAGRRPKDPQP